MTRLLFGDIIKSMKILVDADACPVKEILVRLAREKGIPVLMFMDTSHQLNDGYSTVITVDKAADAVDFAIANRTKRGDVAVTQDYALASMLLARGAFVVHQNGFAYTDQNMDRLLFERHIGKKVRRAGGRSGKIRPRTKADDAAFEACFRRVLEEAAKTQIQ